MKRRNSKSYAQIFSIKLNAVGKKPTLSHIIKVYNDLRFRIESTKDLHSRYSITVLRSQQGLFHHGVSNVRIEGSRRQRGEMLGIQSTLMRLHKNGAAAWVRGNPGHISDIHLFPVIDFHQKHCSHIYLFSQCKGRLRSHMSSTSLGSQMELLSRCLFGFCGLSWKVSCAWAEL